MCLFEDGVGKPAQDRGFVFVRKPENGKTPLLDLAQCRVPLQLLAVKMRAVNSFVDGGRQRVIGPGGR